MSKRMRLRRADGKVYLDRRGFECRWFGVYLHHIAGADPGTVPHDHPWWFASFVLWGGYWERRGQTRNIVADSSGRLFPSLMPQYRHRWSLRSLRLDESHQIIRVLPNTWTLVIRGPKVRTWGFAIPGDRWVYWEYLPREQRDLSIEENL